MHVFLGWGEPLGNFLAQAHGVSHGPGTEQKFNCVSFLLPRKQ